MDWNDSVQLVGSGNGFGTEGFSRIAPCNTQWNIEEIGTEIYMGTPFISNVQAKRHVHFVRSSCLTRLLCITLNQFCQNKPDVVYRTFGCLQDKSPRVRRDGQTPSALVLACRTLILDFRRTVFVGHMEVSPECAPYRKALYHCSSQRVILPSASIGQNRHDFAELGEFWVSWLWLGVHLISGNHFLSDIRGPCRTLYRSLFQKASVSAGQIASSSLTLVNTRRVVIGSGLELILFPTTTSLQNFAPQSALVAKGLRRLRRLPDKSRKSKDTIERIKGSMTLVSRSCDVRSH